MVQQLLCNFYAEQPEAPSPTTVVDPCNWRSSSASARKSRNPLFCDGSSFCRDFGFCLFKQQQNVEVQILMLLFPLWPRQGGAERWRRGRLWIPAATLFRFCNGVQPNLYSYGCLLRQRVEQSRSPPVCNLDNNTNQKSDFCSVWPTSIKSESSDFFSNGEPVRRTLSTNWTIFERGGMEDL